MLRGRVLSMRRSASQKGFTLPELLVVLALFGMFAVIVVTSFTYARAVARDAERLRDIAEIQTALDLYYDTNGSFPDSSGATIPNSSWSSSNDKSWDTLELALLPFMLSLPEDPKQSANGWAGYPDTYAYSYYASSCNYDGQSLDNQWYMIVWRPEVTEVPSPGVSHCRGGTYNYNGTVTIGSSPPVP